MNICGDKEKERVLFCNFANLLRSLSSSLFCVKTSEEERYAPKNNSATLFNQTLT